MQYAPGIIFPNIRSRGPTQPITVEVFGEPFETVGRPDLGPAPGAHVNLPASMVTDSLKPFRINPPNPQHEIMGCETARLWFEDEAGRDAALDAAGYVLQDDDGEA